MISPLAPLALLALGSLQVAQAAYSPLFLGCTSTSFTPTSSVGLYNTMSPTSCATACYENLNGPFTYSYFLADLTRKRAAYGYCVCTNDAPAAGTVAVSPDNTGGAVCSGSQFATYTSASTYSFEGCYASIDATDLSKVAVNEDVASPQECLAFCKPYDTAVLVYNEDSTELGCACGSDGSIVFTEPAACGPQNYLRVAHQANTVISSQFARRQLKERLERAENERRAAVCPRPSTACKISSGFISSFECINTADELESCGGCVNGYYNAKDAEKGATGVDCTSLPGVAKGGVTCNAGSCQVFACQRGFILENNACVQA
ncbi:hypothetical protein I317_01728 [Kwoniella heveanensis CBS 569]|uniref:Protein CPL1-like domain-containing protein n=1 Tax=Kwoniella heveanensis BCC8398 TaxID=1296120 RepID=A0A1B9GT16_9TREE|nr:hypothetical protein I316_04076 [Kwoniella heveanensis BCC8398]OCF44467.1 hypothetical protein I317_01728 [Kwoniella heveanensis CBS 569]